ncbi:MAG: RNA polymerase sigma factor [Candidatus Solibacter sp.]|jgi:RNA polymerase sigma-70 factor (ECF subfamily)
MAEFPDERQLVLLAQCDDREALEGLLIRLQNSLSRYVRGLVGESDSEDVLQDVFVKIWHNVKSLEMPELFRPWAYRIASRTCVEYLKRQRRWSERYDHEAVVENLPSPSLSGFPELISGLEAFLDHVSPASRAVLLLHYGEDLSIEEAAAILDIGIGTAKSRLAYGLACLRKSVIKKG